MYVMTANKLMKIVAKNVLATSPLIVTTAFLTSYMKHPLITAIFVLATAGLIVLYTKLDLEGGS